jgi:hypothetical protein
VVVNAQKHGKDVAELAWDLVRWTREAYRTFRKA